MIFSWLLIIIVAYFFFSLSFFGDKLILSGPPKANSYTFYVGVTSIVVIVFIPFIHFVLPSTMVFLYILCDAIVYVLGLYLMFSALEKFDVSRVMTTIGAVQPVFIFALTWIFWGPQQLSGAYILAFILLVIGGCLISWESNSKTNKSYLILALLSALLFSFDYIFQKIVYTNLSFLQGLVWLRIFTFLFAMLLLLNKNNRKDIFKKKSFFNKTTSLLFIGNQSSGGIANFLQAFAVSLAPVAFLPIVNSLRGIQYVFLFLITIFFSLFFPKILKEKISTGILIQKIISIILIVIGLALLVY